MTHRSRLAGFIIDCQTDDLDAAASFWSRALGMTITDPDAGDERLDLLGADHFPQFQVQARMQLAKLANEFRKHRAADRRHVAQRLKYVFRWPRMSASPPETQ